VLKASSWRVSVWIQTERWIDWRCPHSDRRIIRCYCLPCSSSATRPMLLNNGPLVHLTVPRVWLVYQLVRRLHRRLLMWCRRFIRRFLFFHFLARFWPFVLAFWHVVFLHPWDLEVSTRTCWNNMVSPNDHVVMNHQSQTWTNSVWGHVRYSKNHVNNHTKFLDSNTHAHERLYNRKNTLAKFDLREHMVQDVLFVLTRWSSRKSKLVLVARHRHVSPYNN
jgi:hypothetical protein